jgi:hypothetical protein
MPLSEREVCIRRYTPFVAGYVLYKVAGHWSAWRAYRIADRIG